MLRLELAIRKIGVLVVTAAVLCVAAARASDHLDTPTVIADPAADIGDLFAWTAADGRHLNLVMTIVGGKFSDQIQYVFHVGSGKELGRTTTSTSMLCRFDAANVAECWAGDADYVRGDASKPTGLAGEKHRFRVFAGLRDDPFFNNVKGTRAALGIALQQRDARVDAAECPAFDQATAKQILDSWRMTDGDAGTNFLAGWKSAALVVSIDLDVVDSGGPLLAVWGETYGPSPAADKGGLHRRPALGPPLDRIGRALTANALVGVSAPADVSERRKEEYNRAAPDAWPQFTTDLQLGLALYDGLDGTCGNQWLAGAEPPAPMRYLRLAQLLADDRLWVNSQSTACTQYLAVELAALGTPNSDCGGRTPLYDAVDVFRSLLIRGTTGGVSDGVDRDDKVHSAIEFPFLAEP